MTIQSKSRKYSKAAALRLPSHQEATIFKLVTSYSVLMACALPLLLLLLFSAKYLPYCNARGCSCGVARVRAMHKHNRLADKRSAAIVQQMWDYGRSSYTRYGCILR